MIPYFAELRHDYPFSLDSVVIDVGAYNGDFALQFARKYGCRIVAFEPITKHADWVRQKLAAFGNCEVIELAISDSGRREQWAIKGDMTSFHSAGDETQEVKTEDVATVFHALRFDIVDLLKLNCEGSEYAILDRILATNLILRFVNIQIQWHCCVPDFFMRRARISVALDKTHERTWQDWQFDCGHENWRLR